jgi:N-methylhydantoinase A
MTVSSQGASLRYIMGVDVGGTFTDVFCLDRVDGRAQVAKAPSTPATPGQDVVDGIRSISRALGLDDERSLLARTKLIFHGSTIATNTMLTLGAEPVGLLTTAGFRDIVELRGGIREETFNNRLENAPPLSPRHLRHEIEESVDRHGKLLRPVRATDIDAAVRALRSAGVRSVAVCFKNAYVNSVNEEAAEQQVRELWPEVYVTRSTALTNRARLYDRVSSATVNSFVGPKASGYIHELQRRLENLGFCGRLLIMGGNGGAMSPAEAARSPAKLILSGPAGGPVAGLLTLAAAKRPSNGIVVDMGGTSFDVSVIRSGRVPIANRHEVNRYRVAVPMLDIHTLAAGGGSIAWLDKVGLLKVGPHSAGSVPGPACYGLGGEEPTVTDANLVLGYLDPAVVLGGTRRLDLERARQTVESRIAKPLGLSTEEAAAGIHRVATANMIVGVREMTVERGIDPRGLPMILAGGAAGLHGAEIAEGLGITEVIAPRHAGVFCAMGMARTTLRYDHHVTLMQTIPDIKRDGLRATLESARTRLAESFADMNPDLVRMDFELEVEARYAGQFHELAIPVQEADLLAPENGRLVATFHQAHSDAYGFAQPASPVEIVHLRVTAVGLLERQDRHDSAAKPLGFTPAAPRNIWRDRATGWRAASSYVLAEERDADRALQQVDGPGIVDLPTSTLLVPSGWICSATAAGDFVLSQRARR